ncbi:MAG: DUF1624 domain-containing protein [Roseburia sp.]|nr:DUF1624 domain-containing protein [Roseburia sp.]
MIFAADKSIPTLMRTKKNRVWELDFLRGFAVIAMCFDHLMCDFVFLKSWFSNYRTVNNAFIARMVKFATMYWDSAFRFWAHYIFVFLFLFLVGTSCAFSRDNVKRGSQLFVVAWIFTGASLVMKKIGFLEDGIIFGILDCIALSILCAAAVDIATKRWRIANVFAPLVIGVAIWAFGIHMKLWDLGSPYDREFTAAHLIDYIIGTQGYGDDWFGIFPYVGAVLMGMYFGKAAYPKRVSLLPRLDGKWNKPVKFVGRHALVFYVVHQVVIAGIVAAVCMCLGYRM